MKKCAANKSNVFSSNAFSSFQTHGLISLFRAIGKQDKLVSHAQNCPARLIIFPITLE